MRALFRTSALLVVALLTAATASAQVIQSFQVGVGGFFPRGFDTRVAGDVLIEDLVNGNPLLFKVGDFKGVSFSGEWNAGFGNHLEVGIGAAFYGRSVPSVYRDVVNITGREIEQDLHLRMIPVTAVVRFLPFGRAGGFQPYLGVGVSLINWRYTESGEFVDVNSDIFSARYIASGNAVGPVVLAGLRAPIGGDVYAITLEVRRQFNVTGDISPDRGFLGDRIDLGGTHLTFGVLVRF